jgi:hypothetical protein
VIFLFSWNAGKVNSISHFRFVLKLPPLVDHLVDLLSVFFQFLTNFLLINVAPQPESNSTLIRVLLQKLKFLLLVRFWSGLLFSYRLVRAPN